MSQIEIKRTTHGIPWCLYCVGFHPDEKPTFQSLLERMIAPQKVIVRQAVLFEKKKNLYKDKCCSLCGQAFDGKGDADLTWNLTAFYVKKELEYAGVTGVGDDKVKLIVAQCRKAVKELFKHSHLLRGAVFLKKKAAKEEMEFFDRLTFSGQLNVIINAAIDGRAMKLVSTQTKVK
jgi:hypothetical protein